MDHSAAAGNGTENHFDQVQNELFSDDDAMFSGSENSDSMPHGGYNNDGNANKGENGSGGGYGAFYFNSNIGGRVPCNPSCDDSDQWSGDGGYGYGPHNEGRYENRQENNANNFTTRSQVHVRNMPGYDPKHLGYGIDNVRPPEFHQGGAAASGWVDYLDAQVEGVIPKRALVYHIPVECFSRDATRMTHWQTPMQNPTRATDIAALFGLLWTPTSKGWLYAAHTLEHTHQTRIGSMLTEIALRVRRSGRHEEISTQPDPPPENGAQRNVKQKKTPDRVFRYMYRHPEDLSSSVPMFVICYEELYDSTSTKVLAIRVWKLIFDQEHSDSELVRKLMDENHDQWSQAGVAHAPNSSRRPGLVNEHKTTRQIAGGASISGTRLEYFAGTQYLRIITENVYQQMLPIYAGANDKGGGKHPILLDNLPTATLNRRLEKDNDGKGGDHPLSPEWVFNAKRPEALCAGLVHLNGEPMDINADQVDVGSYFDLATGVFKIPDWLRDEKQGFFFMTDPNAKNPFDLSLPRPIAGDVSPGPELLALFQERLARDVPLGSSRLLDLFKNAMTGTDQFFEKHIREMAESISTFDTAGCTDEERVSFNTAKVAIGAAGGVRSYGMMDGADSVVEPRQALKDLAFESSTVHSKLIQPWVDDTRIALEEEEKKMRLEQHAETSFYDDVFAELRQKEVKFKERHHTLMKELAYMHLTRMERAFTSRVDAETIPAGYRAVWDGLHRELQDMPNKTANIAFGLDMQMTDSDRSVFAHMNNWIGSFFEDDCYVDGRDWRIMQELFYHCFGTCYHIPQPLVMLVYAHCKADTFACPCTTEQFGEHTLLLIFCGPKGMLNPSYHHTHTTHTIQWTIANFAVDTSQATARHCVPSAPSPPSSRAGSPCLALPPPRPACKVRTFYTQTGCLPLKHTLPLTGNSDSSNGCNCVYDEMIDELTDSDGSNRTEYWKMILLKVRSTGRPSFHLFACA